MRSQRRIEEVINRRLRRPIEPGELCAVVASAGGARGAPPPAAREGGPPAAVVRRGGVGGRTAAPRTPCAVRSCPFGRIVACGCGRGAPTEYDKPPASGRTLDGSGNPVSGTSRPASPLTSGWKPSAEGTIDVSGTRATGRQAPPPDGSTPVSHHPRTPSRVSGESPWPADGRHNKRYNRCRLRKSAV